MPKVYCKYCDSYVGLVMGDGIYECSNCGYGLAPVDGVELHGSFGKFNECAEVAFAVMNEAIEYYKAQGWTIDHNCSTASSDGKKVVKICPECPHESRGTKKLYGLPLVQVMRRSIGLPEDGGE